MNICRDIWKQCAGTPDDGRPAKFQVVDTLQAFWQEVYKTVATARLYDVTALLDPFSEASPCLRRFERTIDFADLGPAHPVIWAEAADRRMPAKIAALLTYEEYGELSSQAKRARQCGILGPVKWICRARCFIKREYRKSLPLQWEWQEYVDSQGHSAGSLLQPLAFPEYVDRMVDDELKSMDRLQSDLCAFIANLGLYAVDAINSNRASLTAHRAGTFRYQMVR